MLNIETIRKDIIREYAGQNIHKQVLMQLAYLKYWVLAEEENEKRSNKLKIPYTPSRRRNEDIFLYNEYIKEIEKNGDKNLLVMVNLNNKSYRTKGITPFARRDVHMSYGTYFLVHRTECVEILMREDEADVVG